jgi:hypothetical protein
VSAPQADEGPWTKYQIERPAVIAYVVAIAFVREAAQAVVAWLAQAAQFAEHELIIIAFVWLNVIGNRRRGDVASPSTDGAERVEPKLVLGSPSPGLQAVPISPVQCLRGGKIACGHAAKVRSSSGRGKDGSSGNCWSETRAAGRRTGGRRTKPSGQHDMAKDHFVAQTYLRHFGDPSRKGMLHAYRKSDGKYFPCNTKDVCHEWDGDLNPLLVQSNMLGQFRKLFEPRWHVDHDAAVQNHDAGG